MKLSNFNLGGVEWSIKIDNDRLDDLGLFGLCEFSKALISINDSLKSEDTINQTLYHELVHAILETLDRNDLSNDEFFVQSFALLLHQFEKTKK